MEWIFHIVNSHGHLNGYVGQIEAATMDAKRRAESAVKQVTLDVVIQVWPGRVIPHIGHSGYSPTSTMMQLTFDPANPNFKAHLGETLSRTVAHEFHHCLRSAGPGYGTTVGEALISEGLACLFAHQLYGNKPEDWEKLPADFDREALVNRAFDEWNASIDDRMNWFRGGDGLPPWAIYSVGVCVVGEKLESWGAESTPGIVVNYPAEKFR